MIKKWDLMNESKNKYEQIMMIKTLYSMNKSTISTGNCKGIMIYFS